MLLWLDGFDHTGDPQVSWKYQMFSTRQSLITTGAQAFGLQGGGYSWNIFNTFFAEFALTPPVRFTSNVVDVGAHINAQAYANSGGDPLEPWPFWRWESGVSNPDGTNPFTQLMVGWDNNGFFNWIVGGQGDRFTNPKGTLVATTSPSGYAIPLNTWVHIEMRITFGVSGRIQMWANDLLVFDQSGLNLQNPAHPVNPDRMSLIWNNLAVQGGIFDDWYIADDTGSLNNAQIGPCRISLVFPTGDGIAEGFTRNAGATNASCVQDPGGPGNGPDGTTTQVTTASSGTLDLYEVARPACFGKILGLALNAAAQGGSGASSADLVCRPQSDPTKQFNVGSGIAVPTGYGNNLSIIQAISEQNPVTFSVWRDGDIADALWGQRSGGALDVTQVFVEKLTSLRVQKFDCGGGSYAYTR